MIKNHKQLAVSKAQRDKFAAAIAKLEGELAKRGEADPIAVAYLAMMRADCSRLGKQIAEYELAKSGGFETVSLSGVDSIGSDLVKARIAANLSQEMLAQMVSCKAQQIQRYEVSEYASASLAKLRQISAALLSVLSPAGRATGHRR